METWNGPWVSESCNSDNQNFPSIQFERYQMDWAEVSFDISILIKKSAYWDNTSTIKLLFYPIKIVQSNNTGAEISRCTYGLISLVHVLIILSQNSPKVPFCFAHI